jgi:hypothetical protein
MSSAKYGDVREILDAAQERRIKLRVLGGLAIRKHCYEVDFCEREYADIDLVGLGSQSSDIVKLMVELGYEEARSMTYATGGTRLLFTKPDSPLHIDVFLDQLNIEHAIDLRRRLDIEEDTISVTDLLLAKLTITRINEKDLRDIVTLLKDLTYGEEDKPGMINWRYIASLCSSRWGLYTDVILTIDRILALLNDYVMTDSSRKLVISRLKHLRDQIVETPKTIRWKMRAILGKRIPWRRPVEADSIAATSLEAELARKKHTSPDSD